MSQNICEFIRESAVKGLFDNIGSFSSCWPVWKIELAIKLGSVNATNVINLGDSLTEVFRSTGQKGRSQSEVSGGGAAWEALICWYMNLCLIGSRTVVIKQSKKLLPKPVREAITVKYATFPSNTESDLIAITFPNKPEYTTLDKSQIQLRDHNGLHINIVSRNNTYNYNQVIDALVERDFNDIELGIIQCKTNWNDNAQIPMLWDMVYASNGAFSRNITIGTSAYSIRNIRKFTYSFVTVPTTSSRINKDSTCVNRVRNISGGNYWGLPTQPSVAHSIKDIFENNFSSGSPGGIRSILVNHISSLSSSYSYFNFV